MIVYIHALILVPTLYFSRFAKGPEKRFLHEVLGRFIVPGEGKCKWPEVIGVMPLQTID